MEKYRWYKNKKKETHRRKDSWFTSTGREKVYEENYTRIKGEDDLTPYIKPKPKPKAKKKAKKKK
tara:strand:- start:13 stop:207 length:195 start_codon:yes stop_codon:yes gene_type:complete